MANLPVVCRMWVRNPRQQTQTRQACVRASTRRPGPSPAQSVSPPPPSTQNPHRSLQRKCAPLANKPNWNYFINTNSLSMSSLLWRPRNLHFRRDCLLSRDCLSVCVQMAGIGGRHLASVTRCKTAKAVVEPFITHKPLRPLLIGHRAHHDTKYNIMPTNYASGVQTRSGLYSQKWRKI